MEMEMEMEMEMDGRPRTQSAVAQRLVLTARLRPGTRERALELAGSIIAQLGTSGFERLGVYLSEREVVFLIEAREAELLLREILDDPVRATVISRGFPSSTDRSTARKRSTTGRAVPADTGCSSRHGARGIARTVRRQLIRADASLLHR